MTTDMTTGEGVRIEQDTMGEVEVPAAALWRAQTQRAVENFPVSGRPVEPGADRARWPLIKARGRPGERRARRARRPTSPRRSPPPPTRSPAGAHDDQFPIDVFQTGSGTSSNMNVNEVLAALASRPARAARAPERRRERVAVVATTCSRPPIHLAATRAVARRPGAGAGAPRRPRWRRKAAGLADVVKAGRTHLMDATPVTLGQEFGGYAAQVRHGVERLRAALPRVAELPLGGTAVGTGHQHPARLRRRGDRGPRRARPGCR